MNIEVEILLRSIVYTFTFVCGMIGNLFVIAFFTMKMKKAAQFRWFVIHLAIADCVYATVSPIHLIYLLGTHNRWMLGTFMCKTVSYLGPLTVNVSAWILCFMGYERYRAICHPFAMRFSAKVIHITIGIIWIVCICLKVFTVVRLDVIDDECYVAYSTSIESVVNSGIALFAESIIPFVLLTYYLIRVAIAMHNRSLFFPEKHTTLNISESINSLGALNKDEDTELLETNKNNLLKQNTSKNSLVTFSETCATELDAPTPKLRERKISSNAFATFLEDGSKHSLERDDSESAVKKKKSSTISLIAFNKNGIAEYHEKTVGNFSEFKRRLSNSTEFTRKTSFTKTTESKRRISSTNPKELKRKISATSFLATLDEGRPCTNPTTANSSLKKKKVSAVNSFGILEEDESMQFKERPILKPSIFVTNASTKNSFETLLEDETIQFLPSRSRTYSLTPTSSRNPPPTWHRSQSCTGNELDSYLSMRSSVSQKLNKSKLRMNRSYQSLKAGLARRTSQFAKLKIKNKRDRDIVIVFALAVLLFFITTFPFNAFYFTVICLYSYYFTSEQIIEYNATLIQINDWLGLLVLSGCMVNVGIYSGRFPEFRYQMYIWFMEAKNKIKQLLFKSAIKNENHELKPMMTKV